MSYDRPWRKTSFETSGYFTPGTKWLLIVNTGMFVFRMLASLWPPVDRFLMLVLALMPEAVLRHFAIWQLATYMFLHGGFEHILFNMLALWMCGSMLERDWGTRRFLRYYFVCGIGAGLCDVVLNAALGHWDTRTIGASGGIYGLLLAFGVLYPNQPVYMYFLFPIRAKYLVMIYGAVAFLGALRVNTGVSHVAHLGGMVFGYAYLKLRLRPIKMFNWRALRGEYQAWKLRRARKRFQVYMRKRGSDRDPWIN